MTDPGALLSPYARSLGITLAHQDAAATDLVLCVDFDQSVEGRPGHLHGGAISGLLETTGYAQLTHALAHAGREGRLKPINLTVQFLTGGKRQTSYAAARITKLGRRTANLVVEAWQDDRSRPIASAVMNVMIVPPLSDSTTAASD